MRMINRKELKFEIFIKGYFWRIVNYFEKNETNIKILVSRGFLRSDKLLANCLVKLQPLENSSTLHDAFEV